jgi:hypothetical protein
VGLVSPLGGAPGGSGNLSTSLSNVARLAAHPKFVWVFNANCDVTIIYNNPVHIGRCNVNNIGSVVTICFKFLPDHQIS